MSWETIQEDSNKTIVEYDKDRDMYRVSFFDDDWHFLEDVMFDNYTPRKRGEWIKTSYIEVKRCSCCKQPSNISKGFPRYCPNCGAKMDGGNSNGTL